MADWKVWDAGQFRAAEGPFGATEIEAREADILLGRDLGRLEFHPRSRVTSSRASVPFADAFACGAPGDRVPSRRRPSYRCRANW